MRDYLFLLHINTLNRLKLHCPVNKIQCLLLVKAVYSYSRIIHNLTNLFLKCVCLTCSCRRCPWSHCRTQKCLETGRTQFTDSPHHDTARIPESDDGSSQHMGPAPFVFSPLTLTERRSLARPPARSLSSLLAPVHKPDLTSEFSLARSTLQLAHKGKHLRVKSAGGCRTRNLNDVSVALKVVVLCRESQYFAAK